MARTVGTVPSSSHSCVSERMFLLIVS